MDNYEKQLEELRVAYKELKEKMRKQEEYNKMYDAGSDIGNQIAAMKKGIMDAGVSERFAESIIRDVIAAGMKGMF